MRFWLLLQVTVLSPPKTSNQHLFTQHAHDYSQNLGNLTKIDFCNIKHYYKNSRYYYKKDKTTCSPFLCGESTHTLYQTSQIKTVLTSPIFFTHPNRSFGHFFSIFPQPCSLTQVLGYCLQNKLEHGDFTIKVFTYLWSFPGKTSGPRTAPFRIRNWLINGPARG